MKAAQISDYERERLENIRQNQEFLKSLNIGTGDSFGVFREAVPARKIADTDKTKKRRVAASSAAAAATRKTAKRAAASASPPPARRSKRLRGESAEPATQIEERVVDTGDVSEFLQSADAAFQQEVLDSAVRVTGHYSGWVEEGVMRRLGIKPNATEAWESEGGGKFSFKDPLGTGKKVTRRSLPAGQSAAKFVASKLLKKNPNAYFYRHTEPGVEQWTGDWTEEEKGVFLRIAQLHGCGDKWGLFSTHIPHRVGYQCSNYYRQYVIPEGWVVDDNYRIDGNGHAVYVGKHRRAGQ